MTVLKTTLGKKDEKMQASKNKSAQSEQNISRQIQETYSV